MTVETTTGRPAAVGAPGAERRGGRRYAPPLASYRLQLQAGFGFDDVRRLLPYFDRLGVSHLYFSPIFAAAPGSTHGYDVFDHNQINPELGGLPALYALGEELVARDMGLILDIVPNHVGLANGANPWWRDVLRHGQASRYAPYFDINWEAQPHLPSGVLVYPTLGQPFGAALEAGELRLDVVDDDLAVRYYEAALPLAPRSYPQVVGLPPLELRGELTDPVAFAELLEVLEALPAAPPDEADRLLERFRRLLASEPAIAAHVRAEVARLNGTPGDPASFDRLDALLSAQHYRLSYWRVSGEEINYRRFFDINDLAAIRVEREDVFEEIHRLLFALVERGLVTGVRVDHVDGLYDPASYLERLQRRLHEAGAALPGGPRAIPIYVEKILEEDEELPPNWPVAGTTGYDFMAHNDGLFVDHAAALELTRAYERFLGTPVRFRQLVYEAKRQIARTSFAGEVTVLATQFYRIAQRERLYRDITLRTIRNTIEAMLAAFPVYRTYLIDGRPGARDDERIATALAEARRREPLVSEEVVRLLREVLLLERPDLDPEEQERRLHWRRRFQQLSGPVMAKGFEDTAFYRYHRLVSLNEVGGDPASFGLSPARVHRWFAERAATWPRAMSASSTHDTKRSEDLRARLHVLSELPIRWRREVRVWAQTNRRHRKMLQGEVAPDPNAEYLIYQSLVGSWPEGGRSPGDEYRERLRGYLTKALREAKVHTSWTAPDEAYEAACLDFLAAILDPRRSGTFLRRLDGFVASLRPAATLNALAALIVKATAPGFPDFYQGTELVALSLTDPDNRRPVDFARRQALLDGLPDAPPGDPAAPAMKLWLTRCLLRVRATYPAIFAGDDYQPLPVSGAHADSLFAFARRDDRQFVVTAVPRLTTRLTGGTARFPEPADWADTALELPAGASGWRDLLTGAAVGHGAALPCADLFARLPFAVLAGAAS